MSICLPARLARVGALALLAALAWPMRGFAATPSSLPDVPNRVLDQTGTLDAAQVAALERKLAQFEARRGPQVAVVIVKTTGTDTIEQYAVALFEKNAFGRKGADDGVLLLVAKDDRNARIEVGYGLEGTIPDIHANRILDEHLVPAFRAGDFHGGIDRTTDALMALIEAEAAPETTAASLQPADGTQAASTYTTFPGYEDYLFDAGARLHPTLQGMLAHKLQAFEKRTGSRIAIVFLDRMNDPPQTYARSMLERRPVGHDAYALVVASGVDDRAEIIAGPRLASALTAVERQRIVSEILVPRLTVGSELDALDGATDEMIVAVEGKNSPLYQKVVAARKAAADAADAAAEAAFAAGAPRPLRFWPRGLEELFGTFFMFGIIAAILGRTFGAMLWRLQRELRAGLIAALVGTAGWILLRDHVPLLSVAWAAVAAGTVAFFAKQEWLADGGGSGGSRRSGSRGGGSRSSSSSSRRSSGGRSGGGGASKRW